MKDYTKVVVSIVVLAALLVPSIASAQLNDLSGGYWNERGRDLNHNHGQYEEAIQCYNIAIMLNPNFAEAYYNKGLALNALGRTEEANAAFAKAKELGYKIDPASN